MKWKLLLFIISLLSLIQMEDIHVEEELSKEKGSIYIDTQRMREEQEVYATKGSGTIWISDSLIDPGKDAQILLEYEGKSEEAELVQQKDGYVLTLKEGISKLRAVFHEKQYQWVIYVDRTPPDLQVLLNDQVIDQDTLIQTAFELSILVFEEYIDMDHSYITLNGVEMPFTEDEQHSLSIKKYIEEPKEYVLQIHLQDISGNIYEKKYSLIREFDDIQPVVIFDGSSVSDQNLQHVYGKDITVSLRLDQVQFQEKAFTILDDGREVPVHWEHQEHHHQGTFTISQEGFHKLFVQYQDQAEPLLLIDFYIDKSKPHAQFMGLPSDLYTRGSVDITLMGKDAHLKEEASYLRISCDGISSIYRFSPFSIPMIQKHLDKEGRYEIFYHLEDHAGNVEESEAYVFIIDKSSPKIKTDVETAQELCFYRSDHTVPFIVEELYPDLNQMKIYVNKDGNQLPLTYEWKKVDQEYVSAITFIEEGEYEVFMEAVDMAGNKTRYPQERTMRFVIDKTKPTVGILGVENGSYHQDVEVLLQAEDSFLLSYDIEAYCNHEPASVDGVNMSDTQSIKKKVKFQAFEEDSPKAYELRIIAKDKAGNEAATAYLRFTIDKKPPAVQLQINGRNLEAKQQAVVSDKAALVIHSFDELQSFQEVSISRNGEELISQTQDVVQQDLYYETTLMQEKQKDDVYQVKVLAADQSGNQKEAMFTFRMDTYVPEIRIANDVFHGKPYRFSWKPALVFEQVEFQVKACTLFKDHKLIPYIWGSEIKEEGAYQMYVLIEDEAGNFRSMKDPFSFVIDKSAPDILFLKEEDRTRIHQYYEGEALQVKIILNGDAQDTFSSVVVNDEKLNVNDIAYDEANRPYIDVSLLEEGRHEIKVEAYDAAGNLAQRTLHCLIAPTLYFESRNRLLAGTAVFMLSAVTLLLRKLLHT